MNPLIIAALIVVPFVLFIAAALVYQSQTGTDIVTGERKGVAAEKWGEEEISKITQSPMNNPFVQSSYSTQDCLGDSRCIIGKVTRIIDGDTIKVDGQSVRFALSSAPELDEEGGKDAKKFIEVLCPPGSEVLVDQDDLQPLDKYGRVLGTVYCNDVNLNEELVESKYGYLITGFCSTSEFESESWAQEHGCMAGSILDLESTVPEIQGDCDSSYPDFCIPSSPPDLDCGDIQQKKFTVLQPDPHRFDGDKDGIGCES